MKVFKVLSICGSGTVTSSMVAGKIEDEMEARGLQVKTKTGKPTEALSLTKSEKFDLIVHTSPLPKADYGIPTLQSTSLLTGIGEEEFLIKWKKY